jgi:FkbM family methyltransferase
MASVGSVVDRVLGPRVAARRLVGRHLATGEPELHLVPRLCDPARAFLDVGANVGVYALLAARHSRTVVALEANPALAARLRGVLGDRHTVLAVGASDRAGTATLHIPVRSGADVHWRSSLEPDANPGFASRAVAVPTVPVDDLDLPPVAVVKIDVEGHELPVLRGARALLTRDRPAVVLESEERHTPGGVELARAYLAGLGYRGHYLHRGAVHPIADFDPAVLQAPAAAKQPGGRRDPDYVNNFVFLPAGDPRTPALLSYP